VTVSASRLLRMRPTFSHFVMMAAAISTLGFTQLVIYDKNPAIEENC